MQVLLLWLLGGVRSFWLYTSCNSNLITLKPWVELLQIFLCFFHQHEKYWKFWFWVCARLLGNLPACFDYYFNIKTVFSNVFIAKYFKHHQSWKNFTVNSEISTSCFHHNILLCFLHHIPTFLCINLSILFFKVFQSILRLSWIL